MTSLRRTLSLGVILPVLLLPQIGAAQGLEKIRIVYASRGLPFFSAFVAVFFSRDARIQPEAVRRLIALEKENGGIKDDVDVGHVADLSFVEEVLR